MEAPRYKEYVTDAVVVDCRNGLPAEQLILKRMNTMLPRI